MSVDKKKKSLLQDTRVRIFIIALLLSLVAIHPWYTSDEGLTSNLNYGLDLEGGSWIQVRLQGAVAQVEGDPGTMTKVLAESVIGSPVDIITVKGSTGDTYTTA
ncbi:MAG: preprotein translocase subunit SecD, partial [Methanosarcinaceae archaeon]|nr:preprotein translocase subunit SecD [Methanosarcinaceae archaeon]